MFGKTERELMCSFRGLPSAKDSLSEEHPYNPSDHCSSGILDKRDGRCPIFCLSFSGWGRQSESLS